MRRRITAKRRIYGVADPSIKKKEIIKKLKKENRENWRTLITAPIGIRRKIIVTSFAISYYFTELIIHCFSIKHRNTEAVKRISTAYLKLLFPHVQDASEIAPRDFKRYCFERARKMRQTIKFQVGILDEEYRGKDMPAFKIKGLGDV